ncbi:MAG TPA: asparaginase [Candidatus Tyrphobacter sp.]
MTSSEPLISGEPLVEVTRGDLVESVHRIAACACDARGDVALAIGDVDAPVFLRSAAKPFIAAAAIAAGVRETFGLDEREVAIMAASHSAQPFHLEAVRSILRKIGMGQSALLCGAQLPYNEEAARAMLRRGEAPTTLHNNCSGKHAGILALCRVLGADPATYLDPANPAQRAILSFCARLSDDDPEAWPLAVDGCGIPVYATPLRRAALAFARFASLEGIAQADAAALKIVRDAMIAHPEYVAGTGEFDSELMRVGAGRIASKGGAEGVHGAAVIFSGLGYASKVVDGAARARALFSIAALRHLGALEEEQMAKLASFAKPVVYNRAGRAVGEIRVAAAAFEPEHAKDHGIG